VNNFSVGHKNPWGRAIAVLRLKLSETKSAAQVGESVWDWSLSLPKSTDISPIRPLQPFSTPRVTCKYPANQILIFHINFNPVFDTKIHFCEILSLPLSPLPTRINFFPLDGR
jgi:hypothetical protein